MRLEDKYILARFTYRFGEPIIDDVEYDALEKEIKSLGMLPEYTSRTYDDDPIPFDLIEKFNFNHLLNDAMTVSKFSTYLDSTKSLSIQPVTTITEVWDFVRAHLNQSKSCDFNISLKMDGVNSKALYVNGKLELCISRGRGGTGIDYTKCAVNCLPKTINTDKECVIVYTEAFVLENYLPYFRRKYNKDYKTPKSAAITMLRVEHDKDDYKYLNMVGIDVEGIDFDTKEEKYKFLKDMGFYIAPNLTLTHQFLDKDFNTFSDNIDSVCSKIYEQTKIYPSDGLVLEVSNQNENYNITNQYSSKNIALKLNEWSFSVYDAIVEDIVVEQQRVTASVRIKIKKVTTDDLCDAQWVNGYNPDIIISQGINIGSKIRFERNSGAINCLVYKK